MIIAAGSTHEEIIRMAAERAREEMKEYDARRKEKRKRKIQLCLSP